MDFKILSQEDIPCWYEISFDDKSKKLLFSLHEDYLKHADVEIREDNWFIKKRLEKREFKHFACDFNSDFGFEDCMKNEGVKDNFRMLSFGIPKIRYITDKECGYCNGSKRDEFRDDKCLWCQGSGKEIEMRWENMDAIACTIEVLMKYLHFGAENDKTTSSEKKQLLSLNTMYEKGLDGGSLGGEISPCLAAWLKTLGKEYQFEKAIEHMKYAENKMFMIDMNDGFSMRSFDAIVRGENRLCIGVAGDRTCIHPVDWGYEKNRGYEFSSRNVDTSAQQLELIIGLASVCNKYREEMRERK